MLDMDDPGGATIMTTPWAVIATGSGLRKIAHILPHHRKIDLA